MSDKIFDTVSAAKAQAAYCRREELPMFAPSNGLCPRCGMDIFMGPDGIDVDEAGKRFISSCPICNGTFVD